LELRAAELFCFTRFFILLAPIVLLTACSSQDPQMSAEDFQKPENHAAMETTLAGCGRVLAADPRAANCQNARNAKFALDTAEIGRIRRAQAVEREAAEKAGGLSRVEKSQVLPPAKSDPAGCGLVSAQDTRASNCRNANVAKVMLDKAEIGQIRQAQALSREDEKAGAARKPVDNAPSSR
jgi:hypothetical protein